MVEPSFRPEEITEENILHEINLICEVWGMEIKKKFRDSERLPIAINSGLCRIFLPKQTATGYER